MEIWKPVKNFENLYAVSNLGKVKSLQTNKILKPQKTRKVFQSCCNGKRHTAYKYHWKYIT